MNSPELSQPLAKIQPTPLETIKYLQEEHLIPCQSPFWWSTDYQPDPRQYLAYEEFSKKLVKIDRITGDHYYLYPEPEVPITTIELPVFSQKLNFMVTARPFHPKERNSDPTDRLLWAFDSATSFQAYIQKYNNELFNFSQGTIQKNHDEPLNHFKPHIRGLLASIRNNHFFWYPITPFTFYPESQNEDRLNFALPKNLSYLGLFQTGYSGDHLTYKGLWPELINRPDIFCTNKKPPKLPNLSPKPPKQVQAEKFISDYPREDLSLLYPLRLNGIQHTLPLYIRNVKFDKPTPLIYGIISHEKHHCGLVQITDQEIARQFSQTLSQDFGVPVETLLYVPQPGKPKYQRVSLDKISDL